MPDLVLALDTTTDVTVGVARGREVLASDRVTDRMAHVEQLVPLVHRSLAGAGASLADVGHVVVGLGPGPFTGLRVGIVTAQVLAHVQQARLHGVCSLDVIALAHASSGSFASAGEWNAPGGVGGRPPSGPSSGSFASAGEWNSPGGVGGRPPSGPSSGSFASAGEWNAPGGVGGRPPSGHGDFVVATDARRREVYWARYAADGHRVEGPEVSSPEAVPRLPTVGPAAQVYADRLDAVPGPRVLDAGLLAAYGLDLPSVGTEPLYLRRPDAAEPARRKSVLRLPYGQGARR